MRGKQRTRRSDAYAQSVFVKDDAGQARISKIYDLIRRSKYSIHDISRTELDPDHSLPRFNMPLELGIFLGAKEYGGPSQRQCSIAASSGRDAGVE